MKCRRLLGAWVCLLPPHLVSIQSHRSTFQHYLLMLGQFHTLGLCYLLFPFCTFSVLIYTKEPGSMEMYFSWLFLWLKKWSSYWKLGFSSGKLFLQVHVLYRDTLDCVIVLKLWPLTNGKVMYCRLHWRLLQVGRDFSCQRQPHGSGKSWGVLLGEMSQQIESPICTFSRQMTSSVSWYVILKDTF